MTKERISPFIPEDQKDKDWHMRNHLEYLKNGTYDVSKSMTGLRAREFYTGDFDPLYEHAFLTVSDSGVEFPVDAINFNSILPIVEQMVGAFSARGYSFDVDALSPTAIARKETAKRMIQADYDLLPLAIKSQEMTGAAFVNKDMPMDERELGEKLDSLKDMTEVTMKRLLNDFVNRYKIEMARQVQYRDSNVYGDCHMMIEYVDGYLVPTLLRPGEVFYDTNSRDPLLSDARFYMIIRYMSVSEVYNRYNFTPEDLEKITKMSGNGVVLGALSGSAAWPNRRTGPGGDQVLVSTLYWKDVRVREGTLNQDKYGNKHYGIRDMYGKSKKKAQSSKKIEVEQVRYCTMVGGEVCPEDGWGLIDWIPRTVDDNWTKAAFPVMSLVPRFIDGHQKSTVDLLIPLQGLIDRSMYMISKAMKKDKGRGILYDRSQIPEGYEMEDVMYDMDLLGILEIESRQFGSNAGYNQFQNVDMSISPNAAIYLQLAEMARNEMMRIAGLNDSSMGVMAGASQTLGATQASIGQTNIRQDWYYRLFDMFTKNILQFAGGVLKKCVLDNPARFASIIGDDGVRFLVNNPDVDIEDLGVSVFVDLKSAKDQKMVEDMTVYGIQNGFVDYVDGLKVMMARDDKEMHAMLDKVQQEMQRQKAEQAQAQQQAMQQAQASDAAVKAQVAQEQARIKMMEMQSRERIAQQRDATALKQAKSRNASELQQAVLNYRSRAAGNNRTYTPRV